MTAIVLAGAAVAGFVCFVWLCERSPVVETESERRYREDCEVAKLDAVWDLPEFEAFRAGEYMDRLSRLALEDQA